MVDDVFYEEFIKKQELKNKWTQYWAVLKGDRIYLYCSKDCRKDIDFCEVILLPSDSRCTLLKRRNYCFRFRLSTSDETYFFKCESNLQRHRWIHMIHLASSDRSPESPPNHINMKCCCTGHDKKAMDIANTSKRKSSSLEKIVEDGDNIKEAAEEKEEVELSRDDDSQNASLADSSNNNNTDDDGISSGSPNVFLRNTAFLNRSKSEDLRDLQENSAKIENESSLCESLVEQEDVDASPAEQTRSMKYFTFGSLRRSSRRHSFQSKKENKENADKQDSHLSKKKSAEKTMDFSARFSMDNPAFTFDDSEEQSEVTPSFQYSKIINVSPCLND